MKKIFFSFSIVSCQGSSESLARKGEPWSLVAPGWRGDYKELPSEKIKQERNHKFIKVPNSDHLIKRSQSC